VKETGENYRPDYFYFLFDLNVRYNFPSRLKTLCQLDVSRFPFDVQTCSLTFGSWACNGLELDVTSKSNITDISSVEENAEWEIMESPIIRHEIIYGCCPEPYPDITFYINLRRKPTHYVINIIIPSILITCVAVLGFILPVDAMEPNRSLETCLTYKSAVRYLLLEVIFLQPTFETLKWSA
jgi:hypothetical protein